MYRRIVSLLLLPCVWLTQSAAVGHSHGGSQPTGHDLRPHVHTNPCSAPHSHDHHHHGPEGHHNHHHHDGDDVPESDAQSSLPEQESPSDHDSDAIYISGVDVIIDVRSVVADELAASFMWAAEGTWSISFSTNPLNDATRWSHPPPRPGYSCALYVRHLSLLI